MARSKTAQVRLQWERPEALPPVVREEVVKALGQLLLSEKVSNSKINKGEECDKFRERSQIRSHSSTRRLFLDPSAYDGELPGCAILWVSHYAFGFVLLPSWRPTIILLLREGRMSNDFDEISLAKEWPKHVRSAIVHVVALARTAIVCARAKVSNSPLAAAQLRATLDNARAEISLLREELRIKDSRMATLEPRRRPHYLPTERQSIIELRAARGWSLANTACVFLVQPATIACWYKRLNEQGESQLVKTPTPVNKFPDFVRHVVCRLKVLNPELLTSSS